LVPENLKNFGKYDILYTESCTHYDFFGDTYTTEGRQMLNVDTPQKSYFTYYYNINFKTNECDYAEFKIKEVKTFDIETLPKDMAELQRIYGPPIEEEYNFPLFKDIPDSNSFFESRIFTINEGEKIPLSKDRKRTILISRLLEYIIGNSSLGLVLYKLMLDYEKQEEEILSRKKM